MPPSEDNGGAARAASVIQEQTVIAPETALPEQAPKPGEPLQPGVREKSLADGHKVEQNLSSDPRYLGQEVINRPSGRKIYR